MHPTIQLPEAIERDVRFVEETPPAAIVHATLRRLQEGTPPDRLLAAAALAVSRSTELPPDHHGGPVHPIAGLHAVRSIAARLDGQHAWLPIVQSVALANKHVNAPDMGNSAMPALKPAGPDRDALLKALWYRHPGLAERHLLGALAAMRPGEVLDALLDVAVPRHALDDHFFLYTVFAARALDDLGWEHAPVVLRPVARYLASNPMVDTPGRADTYDAYYHGNLRRYRRVPELERLIEDNGLLSGKLRLETGADEDAGVAALGERIGKVDAYDDVPPMLAGAMGEGLSLAGTAEALSIGAGLLFLRSNSGNPFNTHFHTGINTRRYLLGVPGVALRTRLLALLSWSEGPEIRGMEHTMHWPARATAAEKKPFAGRDAEALVSFIAGAAAGLPPYTLEDYPDPNVLVLPDSLRPIVAAAETYAGRGFDAERLFAALALLTCSDDASEMHAYKQQQACYEEYHATRASHRWVHLAAAAKHAASCYLARPHAVYEELKAVLKAS